jgi:hypothetical protein
MQFVRIAEKIDLAGLSNGFGFVGIVDTTLKRRNTIE